MNETHMQQDAQGAHGARATQEMQDARTTQDARTAQGAHAAQNVRTAQGARVAQDSRSTHEASGFTRRSFFGGAGIAVASVAALGLSGCGAPTGSADKESGASR